MKTLHEFSDLDIDWTLSPTHAVTMYLEWGNNDWHAEHAPVRSKSDVSTYFVVDSWGEPPVIRLVKRNSENAEDLVEVPLPDHLHADWRREYGKLKGVFEPTEKIKKWLRKELYGA